MKQSLHFYIPKLNEPILYKDFIKKEFNGQKFIAHCEETDKKSFKNIKEIIIPKEENYAKSSWHIYPIQVNAKKRKKIFENLQNEGIKAHVHYMPLHLHPFYKKQFGSKIQNNQPRRSKSLHRHG